MIVDGAAEQNDPVFEKAGINVIRTFSATGRFNDHRNGDHERLLESFCSLSVNGLENITPHH